MGQKVNPHGMRVGVIKDWDSRWYARDDKVGDLIVEDHRIREYIKKEIFSAGVPKIEIERSNDVVTLYVHCARPGQVIGKDGAAVEQLRANVAKMIGRNVRLNIVEVRSPDMNAQLVAENIAQQLEKRISHRRAMKNAMGRAMRAGAKGIKCSASGRLGGREIAGVEHYHEGTIPLQTIRADIEYGFAEAATTFGRIGVKVWIYKGEVLTQTLRTTPRTLDTSRPYEERGRRPRRDGGRGPRRDGNRGPRRDGPSSGAPRQGGYPPRRDGAQGSYPPRQGGYPPRRDGQQGGYPPRRDGTQGAAPRQGGYPPRRDGQQGGYPPRRDGQQGSYPPRQGGYPPRRDGAPGGGTQQGGAPRRPAEKPAENKEGGVR